MTDRPAGERPTASPAFRPAFRIAAILLAFVAANALPVSAQEPTPKLDGATIVDSGSTNAAGYKIEVWVDGSATIVIQHRGVEEGALKTFAVPQSVATKFFADLKAARDGKAAGQPCMKSASFGTTTRITWHGWTSPDLDCPPANALMGALVHDVGVIRAASGVDTSTLMRRGHVGAGLTPATAAPAPAPSARPKRR